MFEYLISKTQSLGELIFTPRLVELILAGATVALWLATRALVRESKETAKRQLRAYVHTKETKMLPKRYPDEVAAHGPRPGPIHSFVLYVEVENGGQTPIRNALVDLNYELMATKLPNDFQFPRSNKVEQAVIGPGGIFLTPVIIVSIDDVNKIIAGTHHGYAWGWVDYDDVFEKSPRHRIEFCFEIVPDKGKAAHEIIMRFVNVGRFNGEDDDCYRKPEPFKRPQSQ